MVRPIWVLAGQLGSACSWRPLLARAIAAALPGHWGTPAIFAKRPGGRVASMRVISCSPSERVMRVRKEECSPPVGLAEPALRRGPKGAAVGQSPPPAPEPIVKVVGIWTGSPPAQEANWGPAGWGAPG